MRSRVRALGLRTWAIGLRGMCSSSTAQLNARLTAPSALFWLVGLYPVDFSQARTCVLRRRVTRSLPHAAANW